MPSYSVEGLLFTKFTDTLDWGAPTSTPRRHPASMGALSDHTPSMLCCSRSTASGGHVPRRRQRADGRLDHGWRSGGPQSWRARTRRRMEGDGGHFLRQDQGSSIGAPSAPGSPHPRECNPKLLLYCSPALRPACSLRPQHIASRCILAPTSASAKLRQATLLLKSMGKRRTLASFTCIVDLLQHLLSCPACSHSARAGTIRPRARQVVDAGVEAAYDRHDLGRAPAQGAEETCALKCTSQQAGVALSSALDAISEARKLRDQRSLFARKTDAGSAELYFHCALSLAT